MACCLMLLDLHRSHVAGFPVGAGQREKWTALDKLTVTLEH